MCILKTFSFLILWIFSGISIFAQPSNIRVIAYYSGSSEKLDQYPVEKLTHIIYSFSHLKGNELDISNENSIVTVKKMVGLKNRNPTLKVILSLGGWGGCQTCSEVFSSKNDRKVFARSVKNLLVKYGADGIDLDWEYPAVSGFPGHDYKPEDRKNFTRLVKILRKTLGENYEISFAAGGFEKYMEEAIEWKRVAPLINYVNLMSYDLVHGFSVVTGHHTPLHSTPGQLLSVDYGVKQLIKKGVSKEKIIIGAAFYGRFWEIEPGVNNSLYQPGKFLKSESIRDIEKLLETDSTFQYLWDENAKAPYLYNAIKNLFVTYDDGKSIELKTRYAMENKIGGIMFWELSLDYPEGGLLDVIHNISVK
ncbi:MAG: glycoside hydrolase family 18 protein [Ginsengibacter sp.]